jgi:hypothetical protein
MANIIFGKPLAEVTDEELWRIANNAMLPHVAMLAVSEIQRRQHLKHATEDAGRISKLVDQVAELKTVAESSATSSKWFARAALLIAGVSLFIAFLDLKVYIALPEECSYKHNGEGVPTEKLCTYQIRLGEKSYRWWDEEYKKI